MILFRLEEDREKLEKIIKRMDFKENKQNELVQEIDKELEQCMQTTAKYVDCDKINGIPQRFLTKYLRIRLKDHFEHEKVISIYCYILLLIFNNY